jgi:outer membrane autotransporter protein
MSDRRSRLALFALAATLLAGGAAAQSLVLPTGSIITGPVYRHNNSFVPSVTTGADANTFVGATAPTLSFVPSAPAVAVRTNTYTQYVRFYDGVNSFPVGSFIASANLVRGLTAAQVRDVMALPTMPIFVTIVRVPAGTCVLNGWGAPIVGWGSGGPQQSYLVGISANPGCQSSAYVSGANYVNQQPIGAYALSYRPLGGPGNTGVVAAALDSAAAPQQFTDMDGVYASLDLLNYGDPAPFQAALAQLDGEVYADIGTVQIASQQMLLNVVGERLQTARDNVNAAPGWNIWMSGFGAGGGVSGSGTTHAVSLSYGGIAAGADYRIDPKLVVGWAVAYARSGASTSGVPGSATLNTGSVVTYASYAPGRWYLDGALGYAYGGAQVSRSIVFPGQARAASGQPDANMFLGSIEAGYPLALDPATRVTPLAGLQAVTASRRTFTESRAGAIDLRVSGATVASVRGMLGVQLDHAVQVGLEKPLGLSLRAAWSLEFADAARTAAVGFTGTPDAGFTVHGAPAPRNAAQLGAAVTMPLRAVDLFIRYDGMIGGGYSVNGGSVGLRATF